MTRDEYRKFRTDIELPEYPVAQVKLGEMRGAMFERVVSDLVDYVKESPEIEAKMRQGILLDGGLSLQLRGEEYSYNGYRFVLGDETQKDELHPLKPLCAEFCQNDLCRVAGDDDTIWASSSAPAKMARNFVENYFSAYKPVIEQRVSLFRDQIVQETIEHTEQKVHQLSDDYQQAANTLGRTDKSVEDRIEEMKKSIRRVREDYPPFPPSPPSRKVS